MLGSRRIIAYSFVATLVVITAIIMALQPRPAPVARASAGEPPSSVAQAGPRIAGHGRSPLFSPGYAAELENVIDMEAEDAERLEREVQASPNAWNSRLRLLAYYQRADQAKRSESLSRRRAHVLWLIEHQPESGILASPAARLEPGDLSSREERHAVHLWEQALTDHRSDARVFWNAAQFYRGRNEGTYLRFLRAAVELAPGTWNYAFALGECLGQKVVNALRAENESAASAAWRELQATTNAAVLEPAVRMLQTEFNNSRISGTGTPLFQERAQQLFARLKRLNPNVDEAWVLPQAESNPGAGDSASSPEHEKRRLESMRRSVRRLEAEAFPNLPDGVAAVLKTRRCRIPQPENAGPARNVVRGEFFETGRMGWAVLCWIGGKSSILVFRDENDRSPDEIAGSEDGGYLVDTGQGWISYSRQISAVDRKFIVRHYRAYGGPEPPRIDHNGVDDAFLEKASVTWYWHDGKWLQLQGAD